MCTIIWGMMDGHHGFRMIPGALLYLAIIYNSVHKCRGFGKNNYYTGNDKLNQREVEEGDINPSLTRSAILTELSSLPSTRT